MDTTRTTQELNQGETIRNQLHRWVIDITEANRRLAYNNLMI